MPRDRADIMKKQSNIILVKTKMPDPAKDLTGKRFGKWIVLKYAGTRSHQHMWLCRCDCGMEKNVAQSSLLYQLSTQCLRCAWTRQGMSDTKLYRAWYTANIGGILPKEWQDYEVFREAVGEPPAIAAKLKRYDCTKTHAPGNTYWAMPRTGNIPRQIPQKIKDKCVSEDELLRKIRHAKSRDVLIQSMIAARKAGHTYAWIAIAAGLTRQRVQQILAKLLGKKKYSPSHSAT
jgi:hypothetical protein